jgi:hypothetical protein
VNLADDDTGKSGAGSGVYDDLRTKGLFSIPIIVGFAF